MKNFEDELREALRPPDLPEGFTNRVLARVPEVYEDVPRRPARRVAVWAVSGAICAVLAAGVGLNHERQERIRGEKARQDVMVALRITGSKINQAQSHVRQAVTDGDAKGERP